MSVHDDGTRSFPSDPLFSLPGVPDTFDDGFGGDESTETDAQERAKQERARLDAQLDADLSEKELKRRRYADRAVERYREECFQLERRLREARRENDHLRSAKREARREGREDAKREMQPQIERLQSKVESQREELRAAQDELREKRLEEKFERKYGSGESSVGRELLAMVREHGPEFFQQVMKHVAAQAQQRGAQAGGGSGGGISSGDGAQQPGDGLPDPDDLQAAVSAMQSGGTGADPGGKDAAPPRENPQPHPDASQQMTGTASQPPAPQPSAPDSPDASSAREAAPAPGAGGQVTAAPHVGRGQGDGQMGALPTLAEAPAEAFIEELTSRALQAVREGVSGDVFAAEVREFIAHVEQHGFNPGPDAFVQLTERLIPAVAEHAVPPERVAELLLPFASDLPAFALTMLKSAPPPRIKELFIEPQGVDFGEHDDLLLETLGAIQQQL